MGLNLMKVADVMQKDIDFLHPQMTVKAALRVLFEKEHRGLPVVLPRSNKLVGFITDQDILSRCFPSMEEYIGDVVHARDFTAMEKKLKDVMKLKVKDVMYARVTSIAEHEPIMKAEIMMKLKNISRLPVVDKKHRVTGMIRKRDIFKALASNYM
jgi:CBS domain-containing protein